MTHGRFKHDDAVDLDPHEARDLLFQRGTGRPELNVV